MGPAIEGKKGLVGELVRHTGHKEVIIILRSEANYSA